MGFLCNWWTAFKQGCVVIVSLIVAGIVTIGVVLTGIISSALGIIMTLGITMVTLAAGIAAVIFGCINDKEEN